MLTVETYMELRFKNKIKFPLILSLGNNHFLHFVDILTFNFFLINKNGAVQFSKMTF